MVVGKKKRERYQSALAALYGPPWRGRRKLFEARRPPLLLLRLCCHLKWLRLRPLQEKRSASRAVEKKYHTIFTGESKALRSQDSLTQINFRYPLIFLLPLRSEPLLRSFAHHDKYPIAQTTDEP